MIHQKYCKITVQSAEHVSAVYYIICVSTLNATLIWLSTIITGHGPMLCMQRDAIVVRVKLIFSFFWYPWMHQEMV